MLDRLNCICTRERRIRLGSYSLSVQLAGHSQLSSGRIDGEGVALVPVHDGVAHVIVGGSVNILSNHLWNGKIKMKSKE